MPTESGKRLQVTILLFASLRDAVRADTVLIEVTSESGPVTVTQLLAACGQQQPALAPWLPHVAIAINQQYAQRDSLIHAGDEVALIPPVSGGGR